MLRPRWIPALLLASSFLSGSGWAAVDCMEVAALRISIDSNWFNTRRTLRNYKATFGRGFAERLESLRPGDHWIDAGAGEGIAATEYLRKGDFLGFQGAPKAGVSVVSVRIPESSKSRLEKLVSKGKPLRVFEGRYWEEIPAEELGKADLITDLYGVLSYTRLLDLALAKTLALLKPDGLFFLFLDSEVTRFLRKGGEEVTLLSFLRSIGGIEVTTLQVGPPGPFPRAFRIRRIPGTSLGKVPKLELESLVNEAPPSRVFRFVD